MKKQLLLFSILGSLCCTQAQNVNIPDANFKAYLVGNTAINTNGDGEIQVSEATAYNNVMMIDNLNISDLTGLEAFTSMTALWCTYNQITTLDVSSCTGLTSLTCGNNSLTSLTLNSGLQYLFCDNNSLTSLDLSQVPLLEQLDCQGNSIASIDASGCSAMTYFNAKNNLLVDLDLANGNNTNLNSLYTTGNSSLTCITVDNAFWSNTHWFNIDSQTQFSEDCSNGIVCTVLIPDANFKAYLVGNTLINTNGDGEIQCSEAAAFTGTIDCQNLSIMDLSGIEAFTNLTILFCEDNQLSTLDLTYNTLLQRLFCDNNQLSALNISGITTLEDLGCSYNSLTSLSINTNTSMAWLNCENNDLSALNLSNSNAYTYINCNHNLLTSFDVTGQTGLNYLYCNYNDLTALDVSNNTALIYLHCLYNDISALDVSNNIAMSTFNCTGNQLVTLDLSANANLTSLYCENNLLTSLDVKNTNNSNMTNFYAANNTGLTCVQVDDAAYSSTNWTGGTFQFDSGVSFSEDCSGSTSDVNEYGELGWVEVYPNPAKDELTIKSVISDQYRIINLLGEVVMTHKLSIGINKLDISGLRSGIYFVEVSNGQMIKLIKE